MREALVEKLDGLVDACGAIATYDFRRYRRIAKELYPNSWFPVLRLSIDLNEALKKKDPLAGAEETTNVSED